MFSAPMPVARSAVRVSSMTTASSFAGTITQVVFMQTPLRTRGVNDHLFQHVGSCREIFLDSNSRSEDRVRSNNAPRQRDALNAQPGICTNERTEFFAPRVHKTTRSCAVDSPVVETVIARAYLRAEIDLLFKQRICNEALRADATIVSQHRSFELCRKTNANIVANLQRATQHGIVTNEAILANADRSLQKCTVTNLRACTNSNISFENCCRRNRCAAVCVRTQHMSHNVYDGCELTLHIFPPHSVSFCVSVECSIKNHLMNHKCFTHITKTDLLCMEARSDFECFGLHIVPIHL